MRFDWMALAVTTGFLSAFSAVGAMIYAITGSTSGATRRLQRRLAPSPDLPELVGPKNSVARAVARGLTPLAVLATPTGEDELSALRRKLSHAGHRAPYTLQLYLASKVILALLFVAVLFQINAARAEPIRMLALWAVLVAGAGFFVPSLWLRNRVRERQRSIDEGLPDALDLMVTCVEAGLGLDAAVQRVAAEMVLARPVLSDELTLTFLEVKAGGRRADAFRRLADRTGVQDLKTLAATLNQTDLFGTSVGEALRVQAEGMRVRRMQHAEERAGQLSVKMSLPLVLCFLPTLIAVILGPAVVSIVQVLHGR